jgi:predicted dehydrogenase
MPVEGSALFALAKVVRFVSIYGPGRTIYKVAGRSRIRLPSWPRVARVPDIGLIGCGQFAFATIAYNLRKLPNHRVAACYDIDEHARDTLARAVNIAHACASADELFSIPGLHTVYIASNHASHASYAIQALEHGIQAYVEKPIAVSFAQLVALLRQKSKSEKSVFAGYNRPFSAAIRELRAAVHANKAAAVSMQCFVAGHKLGPNHWYRRAEEGTRVCGNLGHWLDLMVHVFAWRGLPDILEISVACADPSERDDNFNVSISSDRADLFSVMLTSRCEPFEGINETIHFQHGETICKIDDFRRMTLWQGPRLVRRRYWPKDVGHRLAILQPFRVDNSRDWHEVELSTLLMLHVADMVRQGQKRSTFSFSESWSQLCRSIDSA